MKFTDFIEEDAENNVLQYGYFYKEGGVAMGDFYNDGLLDLYFTGDMARRETWGSILGIMLPRATD